MPTDSVVVELHQVSELGSAYRPGGELGADGRG